MRHSPGEYRSSHATPTPTPIATQMELELFHRFPTTLRRTGAAPPSTSHTICFWAALFRLLGAYVSRHSLLRTAESHSTSQREPIFSCKAITRQQPVRGLTIRV